MASMMDLPRDTMFQIFCNLDVRSAVRSERVCKLWRILSSDDKVWRFFYKREWKIFPRTIQEMEFAWKSIFIKRYRWWSPNRNQDSEVCISRFPIDAVTDQFLITDEEIITIGDSKLFVIDLNTLQYRFIYLSVDYDFNTFSWFVMNNNNKDRYLVVSYSGLSIKVYNLITGAGVCLSNGLLLSVSKSRVYRVHCTNNRMLVLTRDRLFLISVNNLSNIELEIEVDNIQRPQISCDNENIYLLDVNQFTVYNNETGAKKYHYELDFVGDESVKFFCASSHKEYFAATTHNKLLLYNKSDGILKHEIHLQHKIGNMWMYDSTFVAVSNDNTAAWVWDIATAALKHTVPLPGSPITAHNESVFASATAYTVQLIDIDSQKKYCSLRGHTRPITSIFIHNSRIITGSYYERSFVIWNFDISHNPYTLDMEASHRSLLETVKSNNVYQVRDQILASVNSKETLFGFTRTLYETALSHHNCVEIFRELTSLPEYHKGIEINAIADLTYPMTSITCKKEFFNLVNKDLASAQIPLSKKLSIVEFVKVLLLRGYVDDYWIETILLALETTSEKTVSKDNMTTLFKFLSENKDSLQLRIAEHLLKSHLEIWKNLPTPNNWGKTAKWKAFVSRWADPYKPSLLQRLKKKFV